MNPIEERWHALFEEIVRDLVRRAQEGDTYALRELKKLEQCINAAVDEVSKISSRDGNKKHAFGTVILRKGITKIEHEAFRDCNQLEKVILPKSVTEIGEYAFFWL